MKSFPDRAMAFDALYPVPVAVDTSVLYFRAPAPCTACKTGTQDWCSQFELGTWEWNGRIIESFQESSSALSCNQCSAVQMCLDRKTCLFRLVFITFVFTLVGRRRTVSEARDGKKGISVTQTQPPDLRELLMGRIVVVTFCMRTSRFNATCCLLPLSSINFIVFDVFSSISALQLVSFQHSDELQNLLSL